MGKLFYAVHCDKHGREITKGAPKEVRVSTPLTRKQRKEGCPLCKTERKERGEG